MGKKPKTYGLAVKAMQQAENTMPKERSTKAQSRKKQVTDVSDALFHVTPQPSIDIFEVLGGAINVQTAAFLTGKTDQIDHATQKSDMAVESNTTLTETATVIVEEPAPISTEEPPQVTVAKQAVQPAEPKEALQETAQANVVTQAKLKSSMESQEELSSHASILPQDSDIPNHTSAIDTETVHTPDLTGMSEVAEAFAPRQSQEPSPSALPQENSIVAPTADYALSHPQQPANNSNVMDSAITHAITHAKTPSISASPTISTATSRHGHDHENSSPLSSEVQQSASRADSVHHSNHASSNMSRALDSETSIENSPHISTQHISRDINVNSMQNSTAPQYAKTAISAPIASSNMAYHMPQNMHAPVQSLLQQLTKREEELLEFLRQHNGQIVSYSQMLKSLNWRESQRCTARNIVARFEANGIIVRQRIHGTRSQGYLFTLCEQNLSMPMQPVQNAMYTTPAQAHNMSPQNPNYSTANSMVNSSQMRQMAYGEHSTANSIVNNSQSHYGASIEPSTPSYIDKIDKLIQSIWQSDRETIMACWPAAGAAGLTSAHLRQLQSIFALQGFEDTTVSLSLRYLDWQLEQGPLTNARGEFIEDPIAYWLSSMRRHGYYGRPKGYVDPLVEAKRLLAEEEEAKLEAQAKLDLMRQQREAAAEEERSQALFQEFMQEGELHAQWPALYQSLPRVLKQKVDANGPSALAKSFAMVRALIKDLL